MRLRDVYQSAPANNIDLIAMVDAYMIACAHMYDAFANDPGLPEIDESDAQAAFAADTALQLCRDYSNTAKHLKRRKPEEIEAAVLEAGSRGTGNFVTIAYGPAHDPRGSTIDALELANSGYAAWQRFMKDHGLTESPLVTPLLQSPRPS